MSVVLLIVVLIILIVVHEFGHFIAAKLAGMRVDEFGIGYPPRAVGFKKGETEYTLNWLPFGGFVKIYGEDGEGDMKTTGASGGQAKAGTTGGRAFSDKNRLVQALVLVAGVAMNLVLAWVLISSVLYVGTPRVLGDEEAMRAPDAKVTISDVMPGSPASEAGLATGDMMNQVIGATGIFKAADAQGFTDFIAAQPEGSAITFDFNRGGEEMVLSVIPKQNVLPSDPDRFALGVGVAVVGTVPVGILEAPVLGAKYTWEMVKMTASGLLHFFASILTLTADLAQVSGPVGIAGAVGTAAHDGLSALVMLTAVISINLAIINLLPIPALDGGRLLFVIIEAIIRRPIPGRVAGTVNTVGFVLLILLMVVVTASDIGKLI